MSGPEFIYLVLGFVVGGAAGYGLRAYRSYLRRQRYRTSSAYHIHGAHGPAPSPKESDKATKTSA